MGAQIAVSGTHGPQSSWSKAVWLFCIAHRVLVEFVEIERHIGNVEAKGATPLISLELPCGLGPDALCMAVSAGSIPAQGSSRVVVGFSSGI